MEGVARICLVHYHEIGLKGRNRNSFEMRLLRNVEAALRDAPVCEVRRISGRILVLMAPEATLEQSVEVEEGLTRFPGVARVSCGYRCERDIDQINEVAKRALDDFGPFASFKVAARRSHTDFPIDSMQMNQLVGAFLHESYPQARVQMKDPDADRKSVV